MATMINLRVERRRITLATELHGLITGAGERRVLRTELDRCLHPQMGYTESLTIGIAETTLKHMVTKYSEQLVFQPVNEIRHWFTYESGAFIEPGYPPLYYSREKGKPFSPNKSAVAAIGEAIAGFLAQRLYRCRKLSRPNHDFPDVVMESGLKTYLVEAKATLVSQKAIKGVIDDEVHRMSRLMTSALFLDQRPVVGLLFGTFLETETDYFVYITELANEL
jgi:hypothetical protein